jgi:hypothetical protein
MSFLNDLDARYSAQDWDEAGAACVVCEDPETGQKTVHGPLPGPVEALKFADDLETKLNVAVEPGDLPWRCYALPLWPARA